MKKILGYTLIASSMLFALHGNAQMINELPLMPWPEKVELAKEQGKLILDNRLTIQISGDNLPDSISRWRQRIEQQTGWTLAPQPAELTKATITIVIKEQVNALPKPDSDESYQLSISKAGAEIKANSRFGAMRGMETLLQMLQNDDQNTFLPLVDITDKPRFGWRGLLLDSARHFMPVNDIKRQLDGMAAAKLNVLHWHLTDDQGWRFESTRYPKLQQLASDGQYYTIEQMKDVVAYATSLGIRVVPEVDFPGHASTIAVAYPEMMSAPGPYQMERKWGVHKPVLDPTRDQVYQFIDDLIAEVVAIFPDHYLHIGGDEVDATQWQASESIQKYMQEHNIKDTHALHAYFNQRLEKMLQKHQRNMVGWDEIYHPDLPRSAVIHSWRGQDSLGTIAQDGYQGILSTGFYIDQPQSTAYHYRNEILPQPLAVNDKVLAGEQAQSWAFTMPRLKGSAVEGTFTLIQNQQGWRGFIDFKNRSRRAITHIDWYSADTVKFTVDSWMGETSPVVTLSGDKLTGYTVVGNVRYPTTGAKLTNAPEGSQPIVPSAANMKNILGGEAAVWAENYTAQAIDLKIWPRTFAISERLWSPATLNDEHNMYQRLAAIDNWSTVSVGLQQHAETARMMTRLANSTDIMPLQILAQAVEPAQYYTRHHLKFQAGNYHQFEPLNRFADALPPESKVVRELDQQIQQLLNNPHDQQAAQIIQQRLQGWIDNAQQAQLIINRNYVLKPMLPVSQDIVAVSTLGLTLINHHQNGTKLTAEEAKKAQILLDNAALVRDEVVIAAVYPVERLLRAVKVAK